ncbi:hypothetical protein [Flavobacterium sp.]|uniref:hypothetical protein n=1 Tax=Flavobacterium sp. TaxID=239 RepID=UPI00286B9D1E|nr:hypothetical protein [Flavobacterium sp.]
MNEKLALLKKIALKAGIAWVKIIGIGILISIIGIIASYFLYQNYEGVNGFGRITNAFRNEFWTVLLFISNVGMFIFSILFANKYAIHTIISIVYKEKLQDFVTPKIEKYISNISNKQPGWLDKLTNASVVKIKLLGELRFDSNISSVNKKVLRYGFKKINLDDVDFSQPHLDYPAIIAYKINEKISKIATPSMKIFWVSAVLLLILLLIAIIKMPR